MGDMASGLDGAYVAGDPDPPFGLSGLVRDRSDRGVADSVDR